MCEDMAERLGGLDWNVVQTSGVRNPLPRLWDMVSTTWKSRGEYHVAHVDVFSGRAFLWAEAVCGALQLAGKPYVLTLRGGGLPEYAHRSQSRVRRLFGSAAAVTTPSRYLLERMAAYRPDIHLLPNPLDLRNYQFRARVRPRPALVWLRAFHAIYNPSLAPRVLDSVAAESPHASLLMIGPDKGDGSLWEVERVASELGVADRLSLPGKVSKGSVACWLNSGDIFLNTTNVDNTPVSVIEAMACGMCVVSTDVGGIPYLLEHEHDALLVPPGDPDAMAAAVLRILNEEGLAEKLSRNARAKAETFSWELILPAWEDVLKGVVRAGARS